MLHSRRSRRKAWVRRLAWVAAAAAAAFAWHHRGPVVYRYHLWKQRRALRQAGQFIAAGDAADAQLAFQVAFAAVPGSLDAYRTAAEMLEGVGAPAALQLREAVVQSMPSSLEDRLALISCALRFRDFNTARDALSGLTPAEAARPDALELALTFALDTGNRPVADALFDRLRAQSPAATDFRVAQDILRLRLPRPEAAAAARRDLESFVANPKYRLRAERELMADAVLRRDYRSAGAWAAKMVADPDSVLSDRLHQANLELLVDHRPFAEVFAALSAGAGGDAADAAEFARWLLAQGRGREAGAWIAGLNPEVRKSPAVVSVTADVAVQLKDWDRLGALLAAGAWGPVGADTVQLAMSAHLLGERDDPGLERQVWEEAVQSAGRSLSALVVLDRLTGVWRLEGEAEDTLWAIARNFPGQVWAEQALFTVYHVRGDTANLRAIVALMAAASPSVPRYRHDLALLTLLADPTPGWDRTKDVLRDFYLQDPGNPYYATSYAFALAQAGRGPAALAVIEKLSPAERAFSPRLPYLAYVYGVNHRKAEVDRLENLAQGVPMLPEERRLFAAAREAADQTPIALPPITRPIVIGRPGSPAPAPLKS